MTEKWFLFSPNRKGKLDNEEFLVSFMGKTLKVSAWVADRIEEGKYYLFRERRADREARARDCLFLQGRIGGEGRR